MIILAGAAICLTVNLRASAERGLAEAQLNRLSSDIEALRSSNLLIQTEIQRMKSDPAIIESVARARLGMVRPTDIVVPIAPTSGANLATLSFVH
jgi:cell division protein FtsB